MNYLWIGFLPVVLAALALGGCGTGSSSSPVASSPNGTQQSVAVLPQFSLTNVAQDPAASGTAFHFSVAASGGSAASVGPVPWNVMTGSTVVASGSVPSIAMGQAFSVSVTDPSGAGNQQYLISVDPNNTISKSNTTAVTATLTTAPDTPPNTVDLFINGPHYHGMYYFGDPIMHFAVHNNSASNVTANNVHVIVTDNDVQVWSQIIPSLAANSEVQFEDQHLPNVPLGTHHTFRIIVDPDHLITETDAATNTNNQYRMEVDVPPERAFPAADTRPNLTWQDPHFHTPFASSGGTSVPWHFMVWNHSTGTTSAGGTWELRRLDGTLVASDVIPPLAPATSLPGLGSSSSVLYEKQVTVEEPFITGSVQYTMTILPTETNESDMGNKVVHFTVLMTQGTGG